MPDNIKNKVGKFDVVNGLVKDTSDISYDIQNNIWHGSAKESKDMVIAIKLACLVTHHRVQQIIYRNWKQGEEYEDLRLYTKEKMQAIFKEALKYCSEAEFLEAVDLKRASRK
jgi:hypothetical protein